MSELERESVLGNLVIALNKLKEIDNFAELMPEVRINLAYSIKNPKTTNDVAAVPGRITVINNKAYIPDLPKFGASDHMARNLIEFSKYDRNIRSGINIKYSKNLIKWLKKFCIEKKLKMSIVDRAKEPQEIRDIDGASIPWKIKEAVRLSGNQIPNIIVEESAMGKEPLILITGENPVKVVELLNLINKSWIEFKNSK
ncbi:MAG: thiamine-phosphate synthase family protein [Candidatus Helarchaeota archaeon]